MGEILSFPTNPERLRPEAETIGWRAVDIVTKQYGDGYEDSRIIPEAENLAYHNMQHTLHVRRDSVAVANALHLSPYDVSLTELAASAHDIVQGKARGQMEYESARWLEAQMRRAGFPKDDIVTAGLAILGTEPLIKNGFIVGQKATEQTYPSERARLIALSVACGDMANLFAPAGPLTSRNIYKETQGVATQDEPRLDGFAAFQKVQLHLLETYRFPHPIAETLFAGLRREAIAYQHAVTNYVATGRITSWQELLELDMAFFRRHRK